MALTDLFSLLGGLVVFIRLYNICEVNRAARIKSLISSILSGFLLSLKESQGRMKRLYGTDSLCLLELRRHSVYGGKESQSSDML